MVLFPLARYPSGMIILYALTIAVKSTVNLDSTTRKKFQDVFILMVGKSFILIHSQWVPVLYGSYPLTAITTCESYNVLVDKNRYSLGKVVPKSTYFYLPWEGKEYYYKYYDVLSINTGSYNQKLSDVVYDTNEANVLEQPPEVLMISPFDNYVCQSIKKIVTLEATTMNKRCWDVQHSAIYGDSINIIVGIP
ncbi:NATT3 protein, partial [Polypterus senegalus]